MRLITFGPPREERFGVLLPDDTVAPVDPAAAAGTRSLTDTVLHELTTRPDFLHAVAEDCRDPRPLDGMRLGPAVPHPRNVFVVGSNYPAHRAEIGDGGTVATGSLPPVVSAKPTSAVSGPRDDIVLPAGVGFLDYEIELALVVGRAGRRIAPRDALSHLAGYTVANDVTARDIVTERARHGPLHWQIYRGKGYDTFLPLGPWLQPARSIQDPGALELRLSVNGEQRQHAKAAEMIMGPAHIIAHISEFTTLECGDVVLTGTPAGTGRFMSPPRPLAAGDRIQAGIESGEVSLGSLDNTVVTERSRP